METIKIKKSLRAFLEKEGVLEQFIKNAIELSSKGKWDNEQINRIGQPFIWSNSPEKHDFWMELDTKFRKSNITYHEILNESLKPIVEHIKAQPETKEMGNTILVLSQQIKGEDVARGIISEGKINDVAFMIFKQMQIDEEFAKLILTTADFYRENKTTTN